MRDLTVWSRSPVSATMRAGQLGAAAGSRTLIMAISVLGHGETIQAKR
jgi:hypothetical protein